MYSTNFNNGDDDCHYYFLQGLAGFLSGLVIKTQPAKQEQKVQFLGWEDSPEEEDRNPLQYSCLGNLMDRGAWQAIVHGVATESDTT